MTEPRIVLIAGPTASGKSALALALAERLGSVIVNADSMQVYSELRVLTARPTAEEEAHAPHRLFGSVSGATAFSSGQWLAAATGEIADALAAGRPAIVVGGTGLYFKALLQGLAPVPEIPAEVRARWRGAAAQRAPAELHEMLRLRDPETAARLRPTDPQRIIRALEVFETTGRPLAELQSEVGGPALPALSVATRIALVPDRGWLTERIARRARQMLTEGGIEEAKSLIALGLPAERPVMKAIGVAEIGTLLAGQALIEDVEAAIVRSTRHYAKRQATWIRGQMRDWTAIDPAEVDMAVFASRVCHGE